MKVELSTSLFVVIVCLSGALFIVLLAGNYILKKDRSARDSTTDTTVIPVLSHMSGRSCARWFAARVPWRGPLLSPSSKVLLEAKPVAQRLLIYFKTYVIFLPPALVISSIIFEVTSVRASTNFRLIHLSTDRVSQ